MKVARSMVVRGMMSCALGLVMRAFPLFVIAAEAVPAAPLRTFTIADGIQTAVFGDPYAGRTSPITVSPDGAMAVVVAERGRLDLNRVEAEVRVYRFTDLKRGLAHDQDGAARQALWAFIEAPSKEGPAVQKIKWLDDSSGFAFLRPTSKGVYQLVLADIGSRSVRALTPDELDVHNFSVKDARTYVYNALDVVGRVESIRNAEPPRIRAVSDRYLLGLLFSTGRYPEYERYTVQRYQVWAVSGNRHVLATDSGTGKPIETSSTFPLAISPDGAFAMARVLPIEIRDSWVGAFRDRNGEVIPLSAGRYREEDVSVWALAQHVLIDVKEGRTSSFPAIVSGNAGSWFGSSLAPKWSADGGAVLLTQAFLSEGSKPRDPCVATVIRIGKSSSTCAVPVGSLPGIPPREEGVGDAAFVDGRGDRISLDIRSGSQITHLELASGDNGVWAVTREGRAPPSPPTVTLEIRQDLNERPVLWVKGPGGEAMPLWDPNPQLDGVALGKVSVYRWTDERGRDWQGGLYLPPRHQPGERHPLVIQNHGFHSRDFRPAGQFPAPFSAQALAASGIVVVQVADCPLRETEDEGPCQVRGYRALVYRLAAEGLIDRDKVGILGYSRTCYYVLEALTDERLHLAAAAMTDGLNGGYFQYLYSMNIAMNAQGRGFDRLMGARPFGTGLKAWLEKAPLFKSDRIKAPLLETAFGEKGLMTMWEPFAALRYQGKPVDLVLLDANEHILTKPSAQMDSQGLTVDWFRFWLQDQEDADPAKVEQYARWRKLREQRDSNRAN